MCELETAGNGQRDKWDDNEQVGQSSVIETKGG